MSAPAPRYRYDEGEKPPMLLDPDDRGAAGAGGAVATPTRPEIPRPATWASCCCVGAGLRPDMSSLRGEANRCIGFMSAWPAPITGQPHPPRNARSECACRKFGFESEDRRLKSSCAGVAWMHPRWNRRNTRGTGLRSLWLAQWRGRQREVLRVAGDWFTSAALFPARRGLVQPG